MAVLLVSPCWSKERTLHSEWILNLELLPQNNPSCSFLVLLNLEATAIIAEIFTVPAHQVGEKFLSVLLTLCKLLLLTVTASVDESVSRSRVTVKITEEKDRPWFKSLSNHGLDCIDLRIDLFRGSYPLSIQVILRVSRASIIPYDHSIRIQHRYYLKDKFVPQ